ncbi:cell division activator [Escherichia coli]|uniref:Cell division activator n=1 Tax=Escherichia coli TaxID=562 RepID=A0A376Y7I0_ECOLX|nr:cell division activator [Escherichia coli]
MNTRKAGRTGANRLNYSFSDFYMRLVKPVMKKPLRQQNRQIISYVPRTEPAPPEHAIKMDSFRDVWDAAWQICCVCTDGRVISALTGVYCA